MIKMVSSLKNLSELIAFKHTIFAFPFIGIILVVGAMKEEYLGVNIIFLSLISATFARSFAMGFNRLLDINIDKKNPRTQNRPSVDGRVSLKTQIVTTTAYAVLFVASTFFINNLAFYLSFLVLLILGFYSYAKRFTYAVHLILGICLGLGPISGDIAISQSIHLHSILLSLSVAFWVAGFDILYSLQDMKFDKKEGLFSIPARFGLTKSLIIVRVFHLLTCFLWFAFIAVLELSYIAYLGTIVCSLLLAYENILVHRSVKNINKAFFAINGYISILYFAFMLFDIVII